MPAKALTAVKPSILAHKKMGVEAMQNVRAA